MSQGILNDQLSVELLSQVLDTNATGIIILDNQNHIIFWNKWLENKSFITKEQAHNTSLFTLFPDLKNSRIHKAIDLSFSKGNASFISHAFNKKTFPLYSNSDKSKPLQQTLHIKRVKLDSKELFCFIQITDSSNAVYREKQLRKMAHDAKNLSQLKSGFVSSVSHELRTPLTSILGSLGLLKSGVTEPSSKGYQDLIDIAYNNANRLLLLISDILDVEKIESGKVELNRSNVNINNLITSCITQNTGLSEKYQVNFNFIPDASLPLINIDPDRIIQVINNLMSNAAKFEPNNGTVEIEALIDGDFLRINVTDHGAGIPLDFRDKVFQTFSQADVSNTKNIPGTGLGLAISKKLIEYHNGEIGFTTELNKGTCFYFTLPV